MVSKTENVFTNGLHTIAQEKNGIGVGHLVKKMQSAKENEATNEFCWKLGNESASKKNFLKNSSVAGYFQHVICWWPKTLGEKQKPRKESASM